MGNTTSEKRDDYLSWEQYFMWIAVLSSKRSKDPNRQVGCCIVDDKNRVVSIGYNGFPNGCSDDHFPWGREGKWIDTKYPYVCHAEANAILNKNSNNIQGATMYVTLFPCNECAKLIIQSGIQKVVYAEYKECQYSTASERMFSASGVKLESMNNFQKTTLTLQSSC